MLFDNLLYWFGWVSLPLAHWCYLPGCRWYGYGRNWWWSGWILRSSKNRLLGSYAADRDRFLEVLRLFFPVCSSRAIRVRFVPHRASCTAIASPIPCELAPTRAFYESGLFSWIVWGFIGLCSLRIQEGRCPCHLLFWPEHVKGWVRWSDFTAIIGDFFLAVTWSALGEQLDALQS